MNTEDPAGVSTHFLVLNRKVLCEQCIGSNEFHRVGSAK